MTALTDTTTRLVNRRRHFSREIISPWSCLLAAVACLALGGFCFWKEDYLASGLGAGGGLVWCAAAIVALLVRRWKA